MTEEQTTEAAPVSAPASDEEGLDGVEEDSKSAAADEDGGSWPPAITGPCAECGCELKAVLLYDNNAPARQASFEVIFGDESSIKGTTDDEGKLYIKNAVCGTATFISGEAKNPGVPKTDQRVSKIYEFSRSNGIPEPDIGILADLTAKNQQISAIDETMELTKGWGEQEGFAESARETLRGYGGRDYSEASNDELIKALEGFRSSMRDEVEKIYKEKKHLLVSEESKKIAKALYDYHSPTNWHHGEDDKLAEKWMHSLGDAYQVYVSPEAMAYKETGIKWRLIWDVSACLLGVIPVFGSIPDVIDTVLWLFDGFTGKEDMKSVLYWVMGMMILVGYVPGMDFIMRPAKAIIGFIGDAIKKVVKVGFLDDAIRICRSGMKGGEGNLINFLKKIVDDLVGLGKKIAGYIRSMCTAITNLIADLSRAITGLPIVKDIIAGFKKFVDDFNNKLDEAVSYMQTKFNEFIEMIKSKFGISIGKNTKEVQEINLGKTGTRSKTVDESKYGTTCAVR